MRIILCLGLLSRSKYFDQRNWEVLQGKRITSISWFSVIAYTVVQTTLTLFYRLLHVCSEFSEETLSSAVLHGVYYPLCCGQSCYECHKEESCHYVHKIAWERFSWRLCDTESCQSVECLHCFCQKVQSLSESKLCLMRPCAYPV